MSKIFIKILIVCIPIISFSQKVEIKHLSNKINTFGSEFNFIQTAKNTALYTSSTLEEEKYQTLIFETKLINNEWQKGTYFNLGESFSYANIYFPSEENCFYFSVIDQFGNSKIASKSYTDFKAIILNNKINLQFSNNTQAHKANYDGESVFYFVSDRKGGFGGYDIWFCVVDEFGNFGEPINAGSRINTVHDEITPFYNIWTKELYFSSNRNKKNGIDIYKNMGSSNLWGDSESVMELNSKDDDLYLSFYDEFSGYFSSNRSPSLFEDGENCCNDIFSFQYPIKDSIILIFNDTIKKHLPISLYFHNDEPNPRTLKISTNTTYKQSYISYYILKEEYLKINPVHEIEKFFEITLKKNYNKLNSTLKYILNSLVNGKEMELHVKGYASPLHEKKYNINLTKRRIVTFLNMLNEFENGQLKPFLENGKLTVIELPFGENKSDKSVSDNPKDKKNSIYSKDAMLERKIEIVEIIEL